MSVGDPGLRAGEGDSWGSEAESYTMSSSSSEGIATGVTAGGGATVREVRFLAGVLFFDASAVGDSSADVRVRTFFFFATAA